MKDDKKSIPECGYSDKEYMQSPLRWLYHYNKKYLWAVSLLALVAAGISGGFILLALVIILYPVLIIQKEHTDCKSPDALMRHLRDNGISISGSSQKQQLIKPGYFHGYK